MKFIAAILILNILLLSSFTGMASFHHGKASCCTGQIKKSCEKQRHSDNDCAKGNCNALLSCGTCGFIVAATLTISPVVPVTNRQTVPPFLTGELSDYHHNGWNPPKA